MSDALAAVRAAGRTGFAAASSGVLYLGLITEARLRPMSHARREAYVRTWAGAVLRAFGVEVVRDGEVPPVGQTRTSSAPAVQTRTPSAPLGAIRPLPRLVVANHQSMVDIPLLLRIFGGHFLARADMARWPFVGEMAKVAGTLFVDRADPSSGAAAVQRMREQLNAGHTVSVFPEGTTFASDEVRPFHAGAFVAVARARGEVLPVGLAYADDAALFGDETFTAHARRLLLADHTRVAVAIGTPIAASGLAIADLRSRAHDAVQQLVYRARQRLESGR